MPPVIRPFNPPVLPTATTTLARATPDVRAAQRAFFQQAIGDTTPVGTPKPVQAVAPAAPRAVEPAATRVRTQPVPDEKPTGYKRPGSYLDIKV